MKKIYKILNKEGELIRGPMFHLSTVKAWIRKNSWLNINNLVILQETCTYINHKYGEVKKQKKLTFEGEIK